MCILISLALGLCLQHQKFWNLKKVGEGDYFASGDISGSVIIWTLDPENAKIIELTQFSKIHKDPICSLSLIECDGIITVLSAAGDGKIVFSTFDKNELSKKSDDKNFLPLYPLCVASSKIKSSSNILSVVATSDYNLRVFITSTYSENDFIQKCEVKIGRVRNYKWKIKNR